MKEGGILEEQDILETLINLDSRAIEINEKRKKQLAELTKRYKEEEVKIINHYKRLIEEETRAAVQKIQQEAQQEVNQLKLNNKELLEDMTQKFETHLVDITEEIVKKILESNR